MKSETSTIWSQPNAAQLLQALTLITDAPDMQRLLGDLLTQKEITEISARLEAARLLRAGNTYVQIVEKTKLSSRTVARISTWLRKGDQGYALALDTISHHEHMSPAVPRS